MISAKDAKLLIERNKLVRRKAITAEALNEWERILEKAIVRATDEMKTSLKLGYYGVTDGAGGDLDEYDRYFTALGYGVEFSDDRVFKIFW